LQADWRSRRRLNRGAAGGVARRRRGLEQALPPEQRPCHTPESANPLRSQASDPVAQLVEQRTFKRAPCVGAPRFMGRDSPDSTVFSALVASHRPSERPSEPSRTAPRVLRSGLGDLTRDRLCFLFCLANLLQGTSTGIALIVVGVALWTVFFAVLVVLMPYFVWQIHDNVKKLRQMAEAWPRGGSGGPRQTVTVVRGGESTQRSILRTLTRRSNERKNTCRRFPFPECPCGD